MSRTTTKGKRRLEGGVWQDDNGPIPGHPGLWDPPMTEEEIVMAARDDPDCRPATGASPSLRRISPAKFVRHKLGMSQEEFSAAYGIPLDMLRAWERHDAEPTTVELAFLRAIEREPKATRVAAE